jgi:hypothetical protein
MKELRVKGISASQIAGLNDALPGNKPHVSKPQLGERAVNAALPGAVNARRGNEERLLRYWRPIMLKDGGFRRCRVILADHPELYPLNNICAWLHHATTGLWPNQGCHHPTMKNCRKKGVKIMKAFTGEEFNNELSHLTGGKKSLNPNDSAKYGDVVVTNDDLDHALKVLIDFVTMEPQFIAHLEDDNNWAIEGEDANTGETFQMPYDRNLHNDGECC